MGSLVRALRRWALAAVALAAVAAVVPAPAGARAKPLPALTPAPRDALTRALETGRLGEAEYALERARSLFRPAQVREAFGTVVRPGPRDATLVLRDLAVRLRFLSGAARAEAERILARPDDGDVPIGNGWTAPPGNQRVECDANVCVHWVDRVGNPDRATTAFKDTVLSTLQDVWAEEIDTIGYRPPLDDSTSSNDGGGPELDVYLDNVGSDGVFGYCTSDDPNARNPTIFTVSAYCVLDNDYSAAQFGTSETPADFLRVTAAHEFNHASQFAYDWLEDAWLLEGTATNMEETVYPGVDDNVNFLRGSQLRRPAWPLDRGGFGDTEYGSWIFWRYLEEKAYGGDPGIIRRIWERADASAFGPDEYSLQATRRALLDDMKSLPDEYASFAVANRLRDYLDGALYPVPPASEVVRLGPGTRSTGWRDWRLNHLTTRFISLQPGPYGSKTAKLEVHVALTRYGSRATLVSRYVGGAVEVRHIALGRRFGGGVRVPFGRGAVRRVDLVLTNGSSRIRSCFTRFGPPSYSCAGVPQDDGQIYSYRATVK